MFQDLRNQYRLAAPWLDKAAARTSLVRGEGLSQIEAEEECGHYFQIDFAFTSADASYCFQRRL